MFLKCIIIGKGIIGLFIVLLACKLIDLVMNKVCKGNWKLLYDDFKDALIQIIEWIFCLLIFALCLVSVFVVFYFFGLLF